MRDTLKNEFEFFSHHSDIIFLDSAASAQKPKKVLKDIQNFATQSYANIHRGAYNLSLKATEQYENARKNIATHFGISSKNLIFTKNGTESANTFAYGISNSYLKNGDEVVLPLSEHHANMVPWIRLAKEKGIVLKFIEPDLKGVFSTDDFKNAITSKTKLITFAHVSNVTGQIFPVQEIVEIAKSKNIITFLDACQSAPHLDVNFSNLGVDGAFITGHKIGAGGTGFLYLTDFLLDLFPPLLVGGDSISFVRPDDYGLLDGITKFESGTPNIEGFIGLSSAVDFLKQCDIKKVREHETKLNTQIIESIKRVCEDFIILGPKDQEKRSGLVSFYHPQVHHSDISMILSQNNICMRNGFHCTNPLHEYLKSPGTLRASTWVYNDKEDIKKLEEALQYAKKLLKF